MLAVGVAAGCTVNGKPLFGGSSTTPSAGGTSSNATATPTDGASQAAPATPSGPEPGLPADQAERYHDALVREFGDLKLSPPRAGVDQAPTGPAGWCNPRTEPPAFGLLSRLKDNYLVEAAGAACTNDQRNPVVQRVSQEILQRWMNFHGLSAADAAESLRLVLDEKLRESSKQALCKSLALDGEIGGADRAFMQARRELFDCGGPTSDRISAAAGNSPMKALVPWLDSSAKPPDEIVRLAFVSSEIDTYVKAAALSGGETFAEQVLLAYAIDQFDIEALDPKRALALAETAPYKGNVYARVVIKQGLGMARLGRMQLEAAVKARAAKDASWKELVVTAPRKGYADWTTAISDFKTELQQSAEFEQVAFGSSKQAAAGCQKKLEPGLARVLKPMKRETASQLVDAMNASPVAGLLFRRYQACRALTGDKLSAIEMRRLSGLRVIRGPRAAAYYATIDALGKIRADRSKFPITEGDIPFANEDILDTLTFQLTNDAPATAYNLDSGKGVIKSIEKAKDGMRVVFAVDKQQVWSESCVQTNKFVMFAHDGRPIYAQACTGKVVTADTSPDPIHVPLELAAGLAPGRMIRFGVSNSQDRRISMPYEVYSDKKGKHLVAYYTVEIK